MSPRRPVPNLKLSSVNMVVRLLAGAALRHDLVYIEETLRILIHLGLFTDIVNATLKLLNIRRTYSKPDKMLLHHKLLIKTLLPKLLNCHLVAINLRYDFIKHSFEAKEIILRGIRHFRNLERIDLSGFCTDELVTKLSRHCPHLRHLSANHSKALSNSALSALTGAIRDGSEFVLGCKELRRLEIFNCPLITASKLVSLILILPKISFISSEKMPIAFESSALFESGQRFQLTNFEHTVSHLERSQEKFYQHLTRGETFLHKVSEIFPKILTVKLTLSYYGDSHVVSQIRCFQNIHTLILELPDGRLEESFQELLMERGHQLKKLCLRVQFANLRDLTSVFQFCPSLTVFQFFTITLFDDGFHGTKWERFPSSEFLVELCLGVGKTFSRNIELFPAIMEELLLKMANMERVALSGICSSWLDDKSIDFLVIQGGLGAIRNLSINGKCPLTLISALSLIQHCQNLDHIPLHGWNLNVEDRLELINFIHANDLNVTI
ncbi:hypothetical protein TCAL_10033 [Tigriopus californicus]|uniref:F-box domain-containing protein n=1 Tax=Tigriopus californicus TaxID=6832 RepID=A0A553PNF4_TIGCA|nr:uncharacterized protein LOC131882413 isoform X1 [Tigriopus californicus]TRY79212.1 hypothetical protein TCAL_10033 [Tigriopus californicus]